MKQKQKKRKKYLYFSHLHKSTLSVYLKNSKNKLEIKNGNKALVCIFTGNQIHS